MAYPYNLADYRMLLSAENSADMESTLSLFQAFSKLYEHDRELLDDVLAADASSSLQVANNYIQGMTCAQPAYLISNLATGKSKPFYSTDGIWTTNGLFWQKVYFLYSWQVLNYWKLYKFSIAFLLFGDPVYNRKFLLLFEYDREDQV